MSQKRFKAHRFHTTLLIPMSIVKKSYAMADPEERLESILLWIDCHQSTHYFREADTVYHKENLNQPMIVDRVLRKVYKANGEQKTKVLGVDVHWWEETPSEEFV